VYRTGYRATYEVTSSVSTQDGKARSKIDALTRRVDRQDLIIHTLIGILLEKHNFTEDEFKEFIIKVDELDGVRDGKRAKPKRGPVECPSCHTKNSPDAAKCVMCGHAIEVDVDIF